MWLLGMGYNKRGKKTVVAQQTLTHLEGERIWVLKSQEQTFSFRIWFPFCCSLFQIRLSLPSSSLGLLKKFLRKLLPQVIVQLGPSNKSLSSPFSNCRLTFYFFFLGCIGLDSQSLSTSIKVQVMKGILRKILCQEPALWIPPQSVRRCLWAGRKRGVRVHNSRHLLTCTMCQQGSGL